MKFGRLTLYIIILSIFAIPGVYAANTQGFEWGFEEGTRFDYALFLQIYDENYIDEEIYVIVDSLLELPEEITEVGQLWTGGMDYVSSYWINGTTNFLYDLWSAKPIGNWQLINEMTQIAFVDSQSSSQIIDTIVSWGFTRNSEYGTTIIHTFTILYSKEDGAVNYRLDEYRDSSTGELSYFSELIRSGYSRESDIISVFSLFAIGSMAAVLVIIIVVYKIKK